MRKYPFTPDQFKEIYSQVPRLSIEVIIRNNDGVLLKKREEESWHGLWHIPGGTVLYKETLVEAAKRIAQEELQLDVTVGKLLGYIHYPSEEQERGFGWSIGLAFDCTPSNNEALLEILDPKLLTFFAQPPANCVEEQIEFINQFC